MSTTEEERLPLTAAWGATVRGTYGTPEAGTRTVYVPWRSSCPVPQARTLRRRPVRVACTYSTEAPGRTCKLSSPPSSSPRTQPRGAPCPAASQA
eukprot:scaffold48415_cov61-Phaeocystis_antarctica.AAC.2